LAHDLRRTIPIVSVFRIESVLAASRCERAIASTLIRVLVAFAVAAGVVASLHSPAEGARGEPIKLVWEEGDVAGMTSIFPPEGDVPIGFVSYRQHRQGDLLHLSRIARFRDGSSDEDTAEARVDGTLKAIGGRSIIRDASGEVIVDLTIDVTGGRIHGSWGKGEERKTFDRAVELPPNTYWGPLIFVALKNFDANEVDGRLVFRTVAPTPEPYVLDLELRRDGQKEIERFGAKLTTEHLSLRPSIHWMVDPIVRIVAPPTDFLILDGEPPALARFTGPRNFAGEEIRLE
jgi:hypothetical protein